MPRRAQGNYGRPGYTAVLLVKSRLKGRKSDLVKREQERNRGKVVQADQEGENGLRPETANTES